MTRLVVGIDGTGMRREHRTNVCEVLAFANRLEAKTIYRRGVGSVQRDRLRGGVGARGINRQIRRTWQDVCRQWTPGDSIWIVGYSRGGAAAISLANLISAIGVTPQGVHSDVAHEAMEAYGGRPGSAGHERIDFRIRYSAANPGIAFLGVFDPVGALGTVWPGRLARLRFGQHDLSVHRRVRRYIALLAEDERRRAFWPIVQHRPGAREVKQIWMPGVHGDIGGPASEHPRALVSLATMLKHMGWSEYVMDVQEASCAPISDSIRGIYRLMSKQGRPWRGWMPHMRGSRRLDVRDYLSE